MSLKHYTSEELEKELEMRKIKQLSIEDMDFGNVINRVNEYVENLKIERDYDTQKQYIVEAAVMAVYGNDVYDKINEIT